MALKIPRFAADDKQKIARFLREAKAAAQLRHQNIVAVHESGEIDGRYYIASSFIAGELLSARLRKNRPEMPILIQWCRELAGAVAYANERGIIHRDIKPGNIIIDRDGAPQLMDFGLAKRLDDDSTATTDGSVLGTPVYMSPEQARGDLDNVGSRSDQYSLGAVLYEMLSCRKPFEGAPHAVVAQVAGNVDPPALKAVVPLLPADLIAICEKAMEKEPARRYDDLREFESDLDDYLHGRPIRARVISPWERMVKWVKRNPTIGRLAIGIVAVTFIGLLATSYFWMQAWTAGQIVQSSLEQLQRQQEELTRGEATSRQLKGEAAVMEARAKEQQQKAIDIEAQAAQEVARQEAMLARSQQQAEEARTEAEQRVAAIRAAAAAESRALDEKQILIARGNLQANLEKAWGAAAAGRGAEGLHYLVEGARRIPRDTDAERFQDLRDTFQQEFVRHRSRLPILKAFGPLAALSSATTPRLSIRSIGMDQIDSRQTRDGRKRVSFEVREVARVSPGSSLSNVPYSDIVLHDLPNEKAFSAAPIENARILSAAVASHGTRVAALSQSEGTELRLRVWSVRTGRLEPLMNLLVGDGLAPSTAVAFTSDNKAIIVSISSSIRVFDSVLGSPAGPPLEFDQYVRRIIPSPTRDGRLLVLSGKTAYVANVSSSQDRLRLPHRAAATAAGFSDDGLWIVTGDEDGLAHLWNAASGEEIGTPMMHEYPVKDAAFVPGTPHVLTVTGDEYPLGRLWDVAELLKVGAGAATQLTATRAVFSPDGTRLLAECQDGLGLFQASGTTLTESTKLRVVGLRGFAFLGEGETFALVDSRNHISVYQTDTTKRVVVSPQFERLPPITFLGGPGKDNLVWVAMESELLSCDLNKRTTVSLCTFPQPPVAFALSESSARLAIATGNERIRVFDRSDRGHFSESRAWTVKPRPSRLLFDATGTRLVAGRSDGAVQVWNADTGEPLTQPMAHRTRTPIEALAFLDAHKVVAINQDGIRVWNGLDGSPLSQWQQSPLPDRAVALTRDGRLAFLNERLRTLTPESIAEIDESVAWIRVATGLQISPTGDLQFLDPPTWAGLKAELDDTP